jgi:tetratricopeptide (TPR) repeat protein
LAAREKPAGTGKKNTACPSTGLTARPGPMSLPTLMLIIFLKSRGPHYDPKRIIIANFEDQTVDKSHEVLGRIVADWITQGVSRAGIADVVDVPPGKSAPGTPEENERLRAAAREAGAGTLVSGAYFLQGKTLSFHARVSDMSNGKLIKALDPVSASVEEPIKAIEVLRQKVMGALAEISDLNRLMQPVDISGQPPTYEAYKEYAAGREAYYREDYSRAIEFCLRAAALDPNFKRPLLQAARAYINLRQYAAGEKLVEEVEKTKEALSPLDLLEFNHLKARYQGDLAGTLRASRQAALTLKGMALYTWGYHALNDNHPREAVKALSMLDPEGVWLKNWPYYWSVLTFAYHMLGRHRTELKQARRGRRQFPESMIILICELRALSALGRIEEIERLVDQSLNVNLKSALFTDPTYHHARVLNEVSPVLRVHGFRQGSLRIADRAVRWMQERPNEEKTRKDYREILGQTYYLSEKWPESQVIYEGLSKEDPENPSYLRMLGALAARRGDREEALRISKQLEDIKKPYLYGYPAYHRACIASLLGEKEAAMRLLREAVSQGRYYGYLYLDMDLEPLRDYPPFKELIRPKG